MAGAFEDNKIKVESVQLKKISYCALVKFVWWWLCKPIFEFSLSLSQAEQYCPSRIKQAFTDNEQY